MIAETRGKLIAAGRQAFTTKGYAGTAMEDLTADVGLTRGALYHHFGGKQGLLEAVIAVIDAEATDRLRVALAQVPTPWEKFVQENIIWVEMALEPEIRRIMLLDGPAVLSDRPRWGMGTGCLVGTAESIAELIRDGVIKSIDAEAAAHLVNGAALNAALWIAGADDPKAAAVKAIAGLRTLLDGLLVAPVIPSS